MTNQDKQSTLFPKRFCFTQLQSPTVQNVCKTLQERGWQQTRFQSLAHFSEKNFEFNLEAAECLEFKHLLAQLVAAVSPPIMPMTFCINDQNWQTVLNQVADQFYRRDPHILDQVDDLVWLLKPATLNNGQNIKIMQRLSQLEQHYLSSDRIGGEHVLQQYMTHPHLLKGPEFGHKYSIRMFVVLTNYAGAYLFPRGYCNIALHPYESTEFTDLRAHLTNEHLNDHERNVVQIPTENYELLKPFYPQIKSIVTATIHQLNDHYPQAFICKKTPALAIFGFDFMVDSDERVWLIEANHGPCFPTADDHPLQNTFYHHFWQAFCQSFVLPIGSKQPTDSIRYELFERVWTIGRHTQTTHNKTQNLRSRALLLV